MDCLLNFWFRKDVVFRPVSATTLPVEKQLTSRNRYAFTPIISAYVLLRRLASDARWHDLKERFLTCSTDLRNILGSNGTPHGSARAYTHRPNYGGPKLDSFFSTVYENILCLSNCVGFIDGTFICIARPTGSLIQRSAYNGHKINHELKYQAVNTPDFIIAHVYGPLEVRRHDWNMYARSQLDGRITEILEVNYNRYCIFGYQGYNRRCFMEFPHQGSNLTSKQRYFNKSM